MSLFKISCAISTIAFTGAGCSAVPLTESGAISSYSNLGTPKGINGKARTFVDGPYVLAAKTISISPTRLSEIASAKITKAEDKRLVANAMDRAMCIALSDRYRLVPSGQAADLTVQAVVSDLVPTNAVIAGVSKVASLGSSAVLPIGLPRFPLGLGGLAVEAEALDVNGVQRVAIVWSRGANSFTNGARVSEIGDAYSLAAAFGKQFSRVLVTGKPNPGFALPSGQSINSAVGGKPKYEACEVFGRSPGLTGAIAGAVGAPPSWIDRSN
ncbi:DUF3313 domain-containing protein [Rhizobium mongolense]|uniref:DUF3313 domain-containing protein n=1 Tax=Rhizobium mongolense TaxID=57676 RepID=UPI0034A4F96D